MTPFTTHTGIIASLPRANIDTDAIIPKQYLKSIYRTGFGQHAFQDWRYLEDGSPNPDFSRFLPERSPIQGSLHSSGRQQLRLRFQP